MFTIYKILKIRLSLKYIFSTISYDIDIICYFIFYNKLILIFCQFNRINSQPMQHRVVKLLPSK